jgi:RecA/RadA recombinase
LDSVLGGGIQRGLITDILCNTKEGRTNFCFSLCVHSVIQSEHNLVIFADTKGSFRPEKIEKFLKYMQQPNSLLGRIKYIRLFSSRAQKLLTERASYFKPVLIVIDDFSSLFSNEYSGFSRHVYIMKYLHKLALNAIQNNIAIVITNSYSTSRFNNRKELHTFGTSIGEYVPRTASIFIHMALKLDRINDAAQFILLIDRLIPKNIRVQIESGLKDVSLIDSN